MAISVCIATYNGEKYINEQITSIIEQLTIDDEIIVVDDSSTDNTVEFLESLKDHRIKIYFNDRNSGVNVSFERAISLAKNDTLFLSDQDDIWIKGRVLLMLTKLSDTGCLFVFSNAKFMDKDRRETINQKYLLKESDSSKKIQNILNIFIGHASYYGCAMAFRKEMMELILPIPGFVESHDLWIALASNLYGSNAHMEEETLIKRIHNNNISLVKRSLLKKIRSRFIFGMSVMVLLFRIKRLKVLKNNDTN